MKLAKRFLTVGVALALTLGLNIPAFAATITVTNPAADETYKAYKLFSLSKSDDGEAYSYYIENTEANAGLIELLDKTIGLDLVESADGSRYNVNMMDESTFATDNKKGMTAADLASALNDLLESDDYNGELGTPDEGQPNGNDVVITVDDKGYYFVDSSLGSLCILNTADDSVKVNEKNTVPSIDKKVQEDSNKEWRDTATVDTIDTIYYQLTVNTGTNSANLGTGIDDDYTIVDTLPDGVTFNAGTVAINGWTQDDYTVTEPTSENGNKLIIVLKMEKLQELAADTDIVITYKAKATTHLTPNTNYTNTAELTYKKQKMTDEAVVKTYDLGTSTSGATITKVDGSDNTPLAGVKFVLSKTVDGATKYATFTNNYLTGWVDSQDHATELVTDSKGNIKAEGLDADTYILTETETLPGYNLLDDTITVVIDENGNETYKLTSTNNALKDKITVVNEAGSQLPTTGGMGTTVLYIAGAALVLGAGITLVVRRRMNSDQ